MHLASFLFFELIGIEESSIEDRGSSENVHSMSVSFQQVHSFLKRVRPVLGIGTLKN